MSAPKYSVGNFVGGAELQVGGWMTGGGMRLVGFVQGAGSMRFQHDMTPEQARGLAVLLRLAADDAEAIQLPLVPA
jgi:hypothetical protein